MRCKLWQEKQVFRSSAFLISEFVGTVCVGVGSSRVRDLFEQAKKQAPLFSLMSLMRLVVSLALKWFYGGNDEREQTQPVAH